MLVAPTPPAGSAAAPGGIVGMTAYAYLPATADLSSVTFEVAETIGRKAALPAANAAIACAFFQPTAAGSTTRSVASQPRYVRYARSDAGASSRAEPPSTIGLPACRFIAQMNFHGSKLSAYATASP
jgi:hypothetical protein